MRVLFKSALVQMKQSIARPMFRFCIFLNPVFSGFLLGMIYQNKSLEDFTLYAFIGSGMSTFWSSICFSSASDIDRERSLGTLPILFTSTAGFKSIILGKIIGNIIWGGISFTISMIVIAIFFKYPIYFHNFIFLSIISILTIISMIALSLILAGLFTISRKVRIMINFIEYPIIILSGFVFPLYILPKPLLFISYLLNTHWAMKGFEISIKGGTTIQMFITVGSLLLITCVYFCISYFIYEKIDKLCRINASLDVF